MYYSKFKQFGPGSNRGCCSLWSATVIQHWKTVNQIIDELDALNGIVETLSLNTIIWSKP